MSNYNVDTLENKIIVEAQEAIKNLESIIGYVKESKNAVDSLKSATGLKSIDKEAKQAASSLTKMQLISQNLKKALNFSGLVYGAKKAFDFLYKSTENSINYVETLNLFEVSMGKIGNSYSNLDSEASQYYTKALKFQKQLNETFGTNIEETMRYQALFNQMAKSMGIGNNASYTMSENLTKLGMDLASLFNKSESATMEALRAGVLAGQTKPLRNYGLDVTQQSLAPLLGDLGIDRKISDLSQAEKMILRYIAVLKQASASHGDFAKTIESPANQLKVLKSQFEELRTAIGNLFQGLLGQVLPYVNAVIMVIKELVKIIGSLFGFKVSSSSKNLADASGLNDLDDSIGNVSAGLGGAASKAKELKAQLMGFDEINNITTETSSGTGGGAGGGLSSTGIDSKLLEGLKEYDNLMDKVRMKATDIRDKIMDWLGFTKIINPLTGEVSWKLREGWTNLKKIWTIIKSLIGLYIGTKILKLIGNFRNLFTILKTGSSTGLTPFVSGLTGIKNALSGVKTWIGVGIDNFKSLTAHGYKAGEALKLTVQGMWDLIPTTVKLAGGVAGLAASMYGAYDSMKDYSEGTKTAGAAFTELGISIGGAAASGALLGSVIPGIGTAVGAVIGVLIGGTTAVLGYKTENDKLVDSINKSNSVIADHITQWEEQKRIVQESIDTQLAEVGYTESLVSELDNLVDANGKVKAGYEDRVKFILNQLNQAYGTEYELVNGEIKNYKELKDSIYKVIDAKKAEIVLEANQAIYAKAIETRTQAYKDYKIALNNTETAQNALKESLEMYGLTLDDYINKTGTYESVMSRFNVSFEKLGKAYDNSKQKVEEASKAWEENNQIIINWEDLKTATLIGDEEEIEKKMVQMTNTYETESGKQTQTIKDKLEMEKEATEKFGKDMYSTAIKYLVDTTKGIQELSDEQIEAWKYLAENDKEAYQKGLSGLDTNARKLVESTTTGIVNQLNAGKTPIYNSAMGIRSSILGPLGENQTLTPTITYKPTVSINTSGAISAFSSYNNAISAGLQNRSTEQLRIMNRVNFRAFAEGGMPDMGEIFMAREAGPELVGKIGRRTAVANNAQIVEAVSRGVFEAVSSAMQSGTTTVQLDVRADEGIIVKKASQGFTEHVMQTGELPFPVPV